VQEAMEEALRKHISEGKDYVDLQVYVKPEANFTGFKMELGELTFYTEEPPLHGRANASLIRYLSRLLKIPSSRIEIVYGVRDRIKRIRIYGVTADQLVEKLISALRETEERTV
jgi:uncharacterized protein YggU (UPF0235/DUF167 family)